MPHMTRKPRKPIEDMIAELRSWLPNYDHGPKDYPTLLWRILASAPGGDEAEDMGYEAFNISWHEIEQLGRMLEVIQDTGDVQDLIAGLMHDENEEEAQVEEARRGRRSVREDRSYGFSTIDDAAAAMANHMGIEFEEARAGLRAHRQEIGRWEDLHGAEYDRVSRLVWAHATDGAAWPWGAEERRR